MATATLRPLKGAQKLILSLGATPLGLEKGVDLFPYSPSPVPPGVPPEKSPFHLGKKTSWLLPQEPRCAHNTTWQTREKRVDSSSSSWKRACAPDSHQRPFSSRNLPLCMPDLSKPQKRGNSPPAYFLLGQGGDGFLEKRG